MRFIDIHAHIGRLLHDLPPNGPDDLIATLDREGIARAAVMAVENPEEVDYYVTTEEVLAACARYPNRLIPFCGLDPRHRYPGRFDPRPILVEYAARGCRGFGEVLAGVPLDHPGLRAIYAVCGELGLPVLFHADHLICSDEPGAPRLERMLRQFPDTIFIGHATRFWAELSADATVERLTDNPYPSGPVTPVGVTDRLLGDYPNLYGDLSAGSGYNALTRDPASRSRSSSSCAAARSSRRRERRSPSATPNGSCDSTIRPASLGPPSDERGSSRDRIAARLPSWYRCLDAIFTRI